MKCNTAVVPCTLVHAETCVSVGLGMACQHQYVPTQAQTPAVLGTAALHTHAPAGHTPAAWPAQLPGFSNSTLARDCCPYAVRTAQSSQGAKRCCVRSRPVSFDE